MEVILAAAIVSLVLGGLFSAMVLASRVAETPYKRSAVDLHALVDRFRQDAAIATAVTSLSSSSVTMTLPDRDGDGTADTVIYNWSQAAGTSGTVTRSDNGAVETIPVRTASFTVTSDVVSTTTTDVSESAEQLLFTRTPLIPVTYAIKSNQWTGQYAIPSLPSNAVAWRVTRVRFPARSKGTATGSTRVQIRSQSGGVPKTVIDEATMAESSLTTSFATKELTFANAGKLPVSSGVCVVLQWAADADAAEIQYESLLAVLATGNRVTSTDSGATWSANTLQAMSMDVYGTYSLPAGVTIKTLRALNLQFNSDTSLATPVTTSIRFNNLPVVSG